VHDQVLTDTARYADLVLPAATNFEYGDLAASYGSYTLQPMPKVIEPVGEAKSNGELAALLAARLGFPAERFAWKPETFLPSLVTDEVAPDTVRVLREPETTVQFRDTFPTDRRLRLAGIHGIDVPQFRDVDSAYPLTLISPASPKLVNSIFGEFNNPDPTLRIHPDDARARAIADGDTVRVYNAQGELSVAARVDADLRTGVVAMTKGVWLRDMQSGRGVNLLVPDSLSDLAGGACFNDARVEVAPQ
jgi:anaerobic selenocysteine-containing dehydrogenase